MYPSGNGSGSRGATLKKIFSDKIESKNKIKIRGGRSGRDQAQLLISDRARRNRARIPTNISPICLLDLVSSHWLRTSLETSLSKPGKPSVGGYKLYDTYYMIFLSKKYNLRTLEKKYFLTKVVNFSLKRLCLRRYRNRKNIVVSFRVFNVDISKYWNWNGIIYRLCSRKFNISRYRKCDEASDDSPGNGLIRSFC